MNTKLLPLAEIRRSILVQDWGLLTSGIEMAYLYKGVKKELLLNELQSADILARLDIIKAYTEQPSRIDVLIERDGKSLWVEYGVFAMVSELSQIDALEIAALREEKELISQWIEEVLSKPVF